jgi:hypothetical protein
MTIDIYNEDWLVFQKYIEEKAKDRCVISSKNWLKLRDYHFEQFIQTVPHPYGLIFRMIYMSKVHKNIPCIHKMYYKYRKERVKELNNTFGKKNKADAYRRHR